MSEKRSDVDVSRIDRTGRRLALRDALEIGHYLVWIIRRVSGWKSDVNNKAPWSQLSAKPLWDSTNGSTYLSIVQDSLVEEGKLLPTSLQRDPHVNRSLSVTVLTQDVVGCYRASLTNRTE